MTTVSVFKVNSIKVSYRFVCFFLTMLSLFGCNDYETSLDDNPMETANNSLTLNAENITLNGLSGVPVFFDFSSRLNASSAEIETSKIEAINSNLCKVDKVGNTEYTFSANQSDDCVFEYTILKSNQDNLSGLIRFSAGTTYEKSTLPVIRKSVIANEELTVDLSFELLNVELDDSFILADNLAVIGNGEAYVVDNTIRFSTDEKYGTAKILYSYNNGEEVEQGTIAVSISEESENTLPVTDNFTIEEELELNDSIIVDVAEQISDEDNDDLQLVDIHDFDSTSSLYDKLDLTNTKFTFQASTVGAHDVAYTVTDHMGGYSTGIVRINVDSGVSEVRDWEDIITHDPFIDHNLRFIAPLSKIYADYIGANYQGTYIEDGTVGPKDAEVITMDLSHARNYCKTRNARLPLVRELNTLFDNEESAYNTHNWPTSVDFWSAENANENKTYTHNLNDSSESVTDKGDLKYITCIDLSSSKVKDFTADFTLSSSDNNHYVYDLIVKSPDNDLSPYADFELKAIDEKMVFSNLLTSVTDSVDASGHSQQDVYDVAFNGTQMNIHVSSNVQRFVFEVEDDNSRIDVNNFELWNYAQFGGVGKNFAPDEKGLPVMHNQNSEQVFVYKQKFTKESFIAKYKLYRENGSGEAVFTIQNDSNDPNQWVGRDQGISTDDSSFGLNTNFYRSTYQAVYNGEFKVNEEYDDPYIKDEIRYVWVDKRAGYVRLFASDTEIRPMDPFGVYSVNSEIGNYWVTISGYNVNNGFVWISGLQFASY